MSPERIKSIAVMDQLLCEFEHGIDRFKITSNKLSLGLPIDAHDVEIIKASVFGMTGILELRIARESEDESLEII